MIIKSMRIFFLLLARLAIVAHTIIPHDHHLSGPDNGQKDSCPLSNEKSDHLPIFPLHCHAFNDLAAEKFSPIIKQEIQTGFISLVWLPDYIIPEVNLLQTTPLDSGKPFPDIYVPDYYPFRAPPSVG